MPTPEVIHSRTSPSRETPFIEYLKNPGQLLAITALVYVGIMIGTNQAIPAFKNYVEILNTIIGR